MCCNRWWWLITDVCRGQQKKRQNFCGTRSLPTLSNSDCPRLQPTSMHYESSSLPPALRYRSLSKPTPLLSGMRSNTLIVSVSAVAIQKRCHAVDNVWSWVLWWLLSKGRYRDELLRRGIWSTEIHWVKHRTLPGKTYMRFTLAERRRLA